MKDLEITFQSLEGFEGIRQRIITYVREHLKDRSSLMEVALIEAVNNAWKHGCCGQGENRVTLKLRVSNGKRLVIRVKDSGSGFRANERLCTLARQQENPFEQCLYDESGRGLLIMNEAADFIRYNKKGNEVLMVKQIPQTVQTQENNTCV